jgi:hypothetical protein
MESHSTRALNVTLIDAPGDSKLWKRSGTTLPATRHLPPRSSPGLALLLVGVLRRGMPVTDHRRTRWASPGRSGPADAGAPVGPWQVAVTRVRATVPTDYLDILVRQGWEDGVSVGSGPVASGEGLLAGGGPARAAPSGGRRLENVFRRWNGPRAHAWQNDCPILEVRPWEEVLAP